MLIRSMAPDDVPAVERITATAFHDLDARTRPADWPEPELRSPTRAERWMDRMRHLLEHDPAGCWVAEDGGTVVGAVAALRRDGMWGLSTFAVTPGLQAQGVGKALLDASLGYAEPGDVGYICWSHDSRAVRRYRLAGFDLHPAMLMWGQVRRAAIPRLPEVRDGDAEDIELLNAIDRACRGHAHGVDHELLVQQFPLKVVDTGKGRAYCFVYPTGAPYLLAATDDDAARKALWASLAESPIDEPCDFHNVTGNQVWAIDLGFSAGLELHNRGYLALRGMTPPTPYLPSGHFL